MTVTHRKRQHQPDEIQTVNEPGLQIQCDSCNNDLTHSIRIKCADPVCEPGDGVDICPACFCAGKEFGRHKRGHAYRVVELHSYPIFSEDWGADEELLLLEGVLLQGLGNWQAIAEHVGTRTKEEIAQHYNSVYVDSPDWPLPKMDLKFSISPTDFQANKRRRISTLQTALPPPPKLPPTSAPGIHEIASFLPGRLEFEHELDNEAEDLVKDLEFGICELWGGNDILEDECDQDVKARKKWEEERRSGGSVEPTFKGVTNGTINGVNGVNGHIVKAKSEDPTSAVTENGNGNAITGMEIDASGEEVTHPPPIETPLSLTFKLTLLEMYAQRIEKRKEAKAIMFDRGLLEYKKMQAAEKKRGKEEKEILHRLRPFARLQTAQDYEAFSTDILYESMLRKRIQELQHYRRMGLTTAADIDKFENDAIKRTQAKANLSRDYYSSERLHLRAAGGRQSSGQPDPRHSMAGDSEGRRSHEREMTPKSMAPTLNAPGIVRKPPAPLNLVNSPSLHLLTPAEQTLCSQLRILPKPYLVIKETLVREYARRGGKLRRREARDLVKIDVNKTSRVWDFLVQAGFLKIAPEPVAVPAPQENGGSATGPSSMPPSLVSSPVKDPIAQAPSRPFLPPTPVMSASTSLNGILPTTLLPNPSISPWPQTS